VREEPEPERDIDTNSIHVIYRFCDIRKVSLLQANLTLAANGRLVIPANMRAALGVQGGAKLVARVVDGAVILEPIDVAVRRAQALVRRYVPDGSSVVDELIAERRAASADE
jgi:antitoxin PrlF